MPTVVSHLECSYTGERVAAGQVHGLSAAGKPLLVRYDLRALGAAISKEALAARRGGFWRYLEFLPVRHAENRIGLSEVMTPLIPLPRLRRVPALDQAHKPLSTQRRQSGILVDVHSVPPWERTFDNISLLGRGRVDNLLKAHI